MEKKIIRAAVFCMLFTVSACISVAHGQGIQVNIQASSGVSQEAVADAQSAVAMVESFFLKMYQMDFNRQVDIYLVANRDEYVIALMKILNYSQEMAEKQASMTHGVATGNEIIAIGAMPSKIARVHMIAHEMTHQYQSAILGGNIVGIRWLVEGTADAMATAITASNGMGTMEGFRRNAINFLRSHPYPDIGSLRTGADWYQVLSQYQETTYPTATLAAYYLIGKVGFEPVFRYYQLVRGGANEYSAFAQAFGMSVQDFEQEYRQYLAYALNS